MKVDGHTHLDNPVSDSEACEHQLASEMVDVSIVLTKPGDSREAANKAVGEYVGKHRDKMIGFAFVDPTREKMNSKVVSSLIEKEGFKGAVVYCSSCGFHPCHSKAMDFYELAVEFGLPVFFHNGGPFGPEAILDYAQPFLLDEIARRFGDLKIIIGTMGAPFVDQTLSMVSKHPNVYGDLTIRPSNIWEVYNVVVSAYEYGVMDKLLFGSGFPYGRASECIETLLGFNKLLGDTALPAVPRDNIQNIIERDSLSLLGIERQE
jgi:predicted TIM-barrel fold metal-dependent hydrolase